MKKYYNVVYTLENLREKISTTVNTIYSTEDGFFNSAKFSAEESLIVLKELQDFKAIPIYVGHRNTLRIVPTFWTEITEEEAKQIEAYRD